MNNKMSSVLTTTPSPSPDYLWTLEDSNVTNLQLGQTVPMRLAKRESLRMMLDIIREASNGSLLLQDVLENISLQELTRCHNPSIKPEALSTVIGCEGLFSSQPAFWLPYGLDDNARRHWRGFALFQDSFCNNPFAASSIEGLMLMIISVVLSETDPLPLLAASYRQQCLDVNDKDERRAI